MNYQYWLEISFFLRDVDQEKVAFEKSSMNPEAMENARNNMTQLVESLRSSLEKRLDKHHASLIIFSLVAAIDEKMQGYDYNTSKVKWTPLQRDFYAAYNAGEIFYKSLDEILDDPDIPDIVYQVYYAMLKSGFQGKYKDSKTQISKYMDMLRDKIPVSNPVEKKVEVATPAAGPKKTKLKKWHCYGLSLMGAAAVFALLTMIARIQ